MKKVKKKNIMKKMISKATIDSLFEDGFSLIRLYENVAREFGLPVAENIVYDCRKIVVASSIMTHWYEQCKEIYGKGSTYELTSLLLNYGPKASENLEDGEVEVEEGYAIETAAA